MKSGRYLHYFDTCIFLHWLSDPQKDAAVVDGIEDIVLAAERQEAVMIVTSVITRIEVLNARLAPDAAERFNRMFGQFTVQTVNVDPRVAQLAHDIRNYYMSQTAVVKLHTPDCIHLATAIHFECDEMNTLDGGGQRPRPSDLLTLSENVMGGKYVIPIRKPVRRPSPSTAPAKAPLFQLLDKQSTKSDEEA